MNNEPTNTLAQMEQALTDQPETGNVNCPVCGVTVIRVNIPNKHFCCDAHRKLFWKLKQKAKAA